MSSLHETWRPLKGVTEERLDEMFTKAQNTGWAGSSSLFDIVKEYQARATSSDVTSGTPTFPTQITEEIIIGRPLSHTVKGDVEVNIDRKKTRVRIHRTPIQRDFSSISKDFPKIP